MNILRLVFVVLMMVPALLYADGELHIAIVADSLTHSPLIKASIYSNNGRLLGMSGKDGNIACATPGDYPITIRYMGYHDKTISRISCDTVFMQQSSAELPELKIVEAKQKGMMHILAYVRDYSTLSSFSDTVTMFREKMVDFMLPVGKKSKYQGWRYPRVLNSRSYYRFTNDKGLDSVSDRCNHHFSWSDWIGIAPAMNLPLKLIANETVSDTLRGKYSSYEIWKKKGDNVSIDVDVLADTVGRKWVPNISSFFRKENIDFEQFNLKLNYDNVLGNEVNINNITGYSFNIESRGRGRGMFRFNRKDQPFFVTTHSEVYILDKVIIPIKEGRKWEKRDFKSNTFEILEPMEAPELKQSTLALIDRINMIDSVQVRLSITPDQRLISRNVKKANFSIGYRALALLKQMTGITLYKSHRNLKNQQKKFRQELREIVIQHRDSIPE